MLKLLYLPELFTTEDILMNILALAKVVFY